MHTCQRPLNTAMLGSAYIEHQSMLRQLCNDASDTTLIENKNAFQYDTYRPLQLSSAWGCLPRRVYIPPWTEFLTYPCETRMHSSRMNTACSSSCGGVSTHPGPYPREQTPPGTMHFPCGQQTHACKHITLPQTSFAGGKHYLSTTTVADGNNGVAPEQGCSIARVTTALTLTFNVNRPFVGLDTVFHWLKGTSVCVFIVILLQWILTKLVTVVIVEFTSSKYPKEFTLEVRLFTE